MITLPAPARVLHPASPPPAKAGPLGPGAGPLMTEYHLGGVLTERDPQKRMERALGVGMEVEWIRSAERIIASKIAGCAWHLEDPEGETIDDGWKGSGVAVAAVNVARALIEGPQDEVPIEDIGRRLSRRGFLSLSSRHLGLAGNAAWMLDIRDGYDLPHALLYIRPDRLTPERNAVGVLTGWTLDKRPGHPGTPIELDDLRLLTLEPPDKGVFGVGLVETALAKALNENLLDAHFASLLRSGGRISGIMSPKDQPLTDDTQFEQIIRDWRNIVEQPEAARRLQIVRAPVDFTTTVQTVEAMGLNSLRDADRDAILALWGVPLTLLNGQHAGATGLNGGDSRQYDEAALWQSAVHDRLVEIRETLQSVLDLWKGPMGWAPVLCFEEPSFDDESPAYERAKSAEGQPLRNWERRQILGLEPFGDDELDNQVWMPMQVVAMAQAPDEDGNWPKATGRSTLKMVDNAPAVPQVPGQMAIDVPATKPPPAPFAGKAMPVAAAARSLRERMQDDLTPHVKGALSVALREQRDDVASAVERNWSAIAAHGGRDESQWWREGRIDRVLPPVAAVVARQASSHLSRVLGG